MLLQQKNSLKPKNLGLNPKKLAKDDKTNKDMKRIEHELSGNDLVQVEDVWQRMDEEKIRVSIEETPHRWQYSYQEDEQSGFLHRAQSPNTN